MTLICANYLDYLKLQGKSRCIFADVRDNLGLKYHGSSDSTSEDKYRLELEALIHGALSQADIFWLSHNANHEALVYNLLFRYLRAWKFRKVVWTYTFGQYQTDDFTSCYRPIVCLQLPGTPDLNFDAIRITSRRMEIGDLRAVGPKIPGNVWEYPRVVGNAKERRAWHPTQHPEALMERIALLSCTSTIEGNTGVIGGFTDLCMGSGTSGIVCKRLGIPFTGIELSPYYCSEVASILGEPFIDLASYLRS